MSNATFEEGTEVVIESVPLALHTGWADTHATGSDVFRTGPRVAVALRVSNLARAAWEKKKYKEGELATEGGHLYIAEGPGLVAKETDENKPSTKPTMWKDLGLEAVGAVIAVLDADFRPAEAIKNAAGTIEVKANGEVVALDSIAAASAHVYEATYRAGSVSP